MKKVSSFILVFKLIQASGFGQCSGYFNAFFSNSGTITNSASAIDASSSTYAILGGSAVATLSCGQAFPYTTDITVYIGSNSAGVGAAGNILYSADGTTFTLQQGYSVTAASAVAQTFTVPSGTRYIRVTRTANSPRLYIINFDYCASVLPLEWLSFTVRQNEQKHNVLRWVVQEKDIDHYAIERSQEGVHFETIAYRTSAGDGTQAYEYVDPYTQPGKILYRLKHVDKDGTTAYSSIISITHSDNASFSAYPTLFSSDITIQSQQEQEVQLFDTYGIPIRNILLQEGPNPVHFDNLPDGVYFLRNKEHVTVRLLKND